MNRADFLKRLGLGAIGIAVAPTILADIGEYPPKGKGWFSRTYQTTTKRSEWNPNISAHSYYYVGYDMICDNITAKDIIIAWKQNGQLIYK